MGFPVGTVLKKERYRVDPETGCWIWLLSRQGKYGADVLDGKCITAHKKAYILKYGPVPDGLQVDHTCRNTLCVNPDHLEAVPQVINLRRSRVAKITIEIAREVREAFRTGLKQKAIAEQFSIHPSVVSRIVNHKYWRELS